MQKRFLSVWFRYLKTDWVSNRRPELKQGPLILSIPDHGRMVVAARNKHAEQYGIFNGMVVADARAIYPKVQVLDDIPQLENRLLHAFALWCIRFTPVAAVDPPDGIILDITGCAHLWGGEEKYADNISNRLTQFGYHVRTGIADTIGAAWAAARFARENIIVKGQQMESISLLPPQALRINPETVERLQQLGLKHINQFLHMPRRALSSRFGQELLTRIDQAIGNTEEIACPVTPVTPFQERLPCLEPIVTLTGIQVALENMLSLLCARLQKEGKGCRNLKLTCYRVDNTFRHVRIGTHRSSQNPKHLFKLFEEKIQTIAPDAGIELFTLDASVVEDVSAQQEKLWESNYGLENMAIAELIDSIAARIGAKNIRRFLPDEHYWPERSIKQTAAITEKATTTWPAAKRRPLQLLQQPQLVQVTAPIPDYPPMLFRYKGEVHNIKKADGPERIEQEWWIEEGEHRDYYMVEDESGNRYWIFRLGHYDPGKNNQWFLHGYFA